LRDIQAKQLNLKCTLNQQQVQPSFKVQAIDEITLCKQKVKSYPQDQLHYFNRVIVQNKKKNTHYGGNGDKYYCVLHYFKPYELITIVPTFPKGVLLGKQQGQPQLQCQLLDTSNNWLNVSTHDYEPMGQHVWS
jgi:hypothetical protein